MRSQSKRTAAASGFTLIEVLTVVAILSILAAIALPSYTSYVARARRADARTQLLQAAQFMQRFYAANDSFQADRTGVPVADLVPVPLRTSPAEGAAQYRLEITPSALTASSYQLRMVPEAAGAMSNDKCGAFTITSTGVRGVWVSGAAGSAELRDTCWK